MKHDINKSNKNPNHTGGDKLYGIITTIFIAIAFVILIGIGMGSCVHDNSRRKIGKENLNLAWEAYDKGEIEKALEYAIASDYDYESCDISMESADTHCLIILLYYMAGLKEEALERVKKIKLEELHLIDPGTRANYYLLAAYLYASIEHDKDKARTYTDSLINHHASANPGDSAMNYLDVNNIVEIYLAIGDTANSWQLIHQMENNPVEPVSRYIHQLNINKARLFDIVENNDSAVKYAREILNKNFNENVDVYNRSLAYRILMRSDSIDGNLSQYAAHRDSLDHLRYEIHGNHKKYMIAAIEGRDRAEELLKDIQIQKSRTILWILSICFASIFTIAIVIWKLRERKSKHKIAVLECQRLAAEVKSSQMLCEHLAGEVRTRNDELLLHINEKEELTRQLLNAMNDMASISPMDHLRLRLQQEQPRFMAFLNHRFAEISANDRLILGAIRIGLTPKETAIALSISHSSILTARYRLRKKLAISSETDLDDFVANLDF